MQCVVYWNTETGLRTMGGPGREGETMEYLDVVDETGCPTGQTVERSVAHAQGIRHRTAHVWLVRRRAGRLQVLLQKRSENKDSNPGKYDISSAGHIPAGVEWKPSALRELQEELGVNAREEQLHYCGQRRFFHQAFFHGKPFLDRQVSNVYLLWLDWDEKKFTLQKEEVSEVRWLDFEACLRDVKAGTIPNCIAPEELELVQQAAGAT